MAQRGLTRETIVAEALLLLDETGLEGLNMRSLATRLQVKAPALYWHFSSKQDLVDEMATALWREVITAVLAEPAASGRDGLVRFALTLRRTLLAHRDGARLFSGTYLTDVTILEAQEEPLAALVAEGMALDTAVEVSGVLYAYTIGATIEEQSIVQTSKTDDRYDLEKRRQRLDPERFPMVTAAGQLVFPDLAARFERSVRRLVAAFAEWDTRDTP